MDKPNRPSPPPFGHDKAINPKPIPADPAAIESSVVFLR